MSATQSNLSNAHFGYDFVVATTQESINATMKEYLYDSEFPVVKMYWNQDAMGNPVPVSYEDLMTQTNNTDPLMVPSWTAGEPMTPDIQNINNSNFYFAFEAQIGIPDDLDPSNIPNIIELPDAGQTVTFTLISREFTVVSCTFGRQGLTSFESVSQLPDSPWLFKSKVDLTTIIDNNNLPPDVQAQLDNFSSTAFSVQQLFFDLDNAALESVPEISGVEPGTPAYSLLEQVFIGAYFTAIQEAGQPVLNYSIIQKEPTGETSTLYLTNMELETSPYIPPSGQPTDSDLNTLNYLCATSGHTLPPASAFNWNWVEQSEKASFDGVTSINRSTFAEYLKAQLKEYVSSNCFKPSVNVSFTDDDTQIKYEWSVDPDQTPTTTKPATGSEVLSYSYSSSDSDDADLLGVTMGAMTLSTTFSATVTLSGNTIVVKQHLVIHTKVTANLDSESWDPFDKTITDTYTLAVDDNGNLTTSKPTTHESDNSDPTPSENWFVEAFTDLNQLMDDVADWTQGFFATAFHSIPVNVAQKFVFPGGNTFAFKDVVFSQYQDLVAHITYIQP